MAELWDWFVSYDKAYGTFVGEKKSDKGKLEGKAVTMRAPLDQDLWESHLAGTGPGIGAIALLDDGLLRWGAADIDVYPLDLVKLSRKIKDLPLVLFRSKSGGAHLVCFVRDPVSAKDMVEYLAKLGAALGYTGCEVFPKQVSRASANDPGSWLNMPYYGHTDTTKIPSRYAIYDGHDLTYAQCLDLIERKAMDPEQFSDALVDIDEIEFEQDSPQSPGRPSDKPADAAPKRKLPAPKGEMFADGPPCLQRLCNPENEEGSGFPDGQRSRGMFNVAVYLKKKHPEDWPDMIGDYRKLCDPPMDRKELDATIKKSMARKPYSYTCKLEPIHQVCQRTLCLKREFGVGSDDDKLDPDEKLNLTKYEGTPVLWVAEIQGRRLELTTDELMRQPLFASRCAEVLTLVPNTYSAGKWNKLLQASMQTAIIVPPEPDEETEEGQFLVLLEAFCTRGAQAKSREQLKEGQPYTENGFTWFPGNALRQFLRNAGFKFGPRRDLNRMLANIGYKKDNWVIRGRPTPVWGVPAYQDQEVVLPEMPQMTREEGEEF